MTKLRRSNSRIQSERYAGLEKEGIVSHEQADQMRLQAKADASAVEADKAAVEAARVQLQYTDIAAPINARAGHLMINLGNLVKANDTPYLVQLNQVTPIYVTFSVPEANLDRVRRHFPLAGSSRFWLIPRDNGQSGRRKVDVHRQWRRHNDRHVKLKGHFGTGSATVARRIRRRCAGTLNTEKCRHSPDESDPDRAARRIRLCRRRGQYR